MQLTRIQINNFWNKVTKTDSCWNWIAFTNKNGYGQFRINERMYYVHRISAYLNNKNITINNPKGGSRGNLILHTCDNTSCVNPSHLKIGNQKDNMQDAKLKNRARKHNGEYNNRAKLSWVDVKLIRSPHFTIQNFRENFRISESQFYRIKSNKHWVNI